MQIAVISDLHLTARDGLDEFGHDDGAFLRFLDFLERNFERVVLLGDIWETLNPRLPGKFSARLDEARRAHPEIARRFERPCYKYVYGNHDLVAKYRGAPLSFRLTVDGKRLFFTHGHIYDSLILRARRLSELGVFLGGWLCRLGFYPLYRACSQLDLWLAQRAAKQVNDTASERSSEFYRWALSFAEAHRADIIVTGHTHVAHSIESRGHLFLNSGSCTGGKFSYLTLDTRRDDYRVMSTW